MTGFMTRERLAQDAAALGIRPGDMVIAHVAMSRVGPTLEGPDTLIGALIDTIGPGGTLIGYTDWGTAYEDIVDEDGRAPPAWRAYVAPFDPLTSRAIRHNGVFPEWLRTWPGAVRSASPGPSVVSVGARADWVTADHALDYGYGPQSPFARIVEARGKVMMIGAPHDTVTLLHHAEHLADIPRKRIKRLEVPFATPAGTHWRMIEEYDTDDPVHPDLADDYFATIVADFLATGEGGARAIGNAPSLLMDAADLVAFAVRWLEGRGLT